MLGALSIAASYLALIWVYGWKGALAGAALGLVLLVALPRR